MVKVKKWTERSYYISNCREILSVSVVPNLLDYWELDAKFSTHPPTCGLAKFITCTIKVHYKTNNCCKRIHPFYIAIKVRENDRRQQALLENQDLLRTFMSFRVE